MKLSEIRKSASQFVQDKLSKKSWFLRAAGALAGGTAIAQIITLLALPIVTRIYTPKEFGVLAIFISILTSFSAISCMRFEIAIPVPEKDGDAANLMALALVICLAISLISGVILLLAQNHILNFLGNQDIAKYLWLIPVSIAILGFYSALQFWSVRKKRYGAIVRTRFKQSFGGSATQILLGWLGWGGAGLILGYLVNSAAGILGFGRQIFREDKDSLKKIRLKKMREIGGKYIKYPKYSVLEVLATNSAVQLPIIIMAASVSSTEVGFVLLASRVIAAPVGLIGGAISQVYLSSAPKNFREGKLVEFTLYVINQIIKIGAGPLCFLGMISPMVFPLVFGNDWRRAGMLLAWMTPWFLLQMIATAIAMALHVTDNQKAALGANIAGFVIRAGGVGAAAVVVPSIASEVYAVSGFLFYSLYLATILVKLDINFISLVKAVHKNCKPLILWISVAILIDVLLWSAS
ncbi:oligosaccharide flippase family protein [Variovorax paradoxus]|uniref:lipopolysaccharide biosynthesis protein n=1 Tax=Variovorax paradoxus TaxID=34073 RepID=UPI0009B73356|nr:oligosaccharide flippase family protein [Variovorax paradoxus]